MIIAGVPISLRELPDLVRGWARLRMLASDGRAVRARLNFLYFSYAPDFDCVALSLRTLAHAVPDELIGGVTLAEDQKAPFTPGQVAALRAHAPSLQVVPVRDFEWGSPRSTHAELQIFRQVCEKLPDPWDLLVKVDSDVLFIRNAKWRTLLRSNAPAIGDGHYLQHRFAQGGLYMIRRHIVEDVLSKAGLADVEAVAKAIDSVGEDMAISQLLADRGRPFLFTRLMLFPDEYGPLSRLNTVVRREFLALHCHKDKPSMPMLAQRFSLLDQPAIAT